MFDIGWSEMVVVLIVAVLVVGPKDLPRAVATMSKYIRKARAMAREFQSGLNDLAREAELEDLKKQVSSTERDIMKQVEEAVDPTGSMQGMFDDIKPVIRETTEKSPGGAKPVAAAMIAATAAAAEEGGTATDAATEAEDAPPQSRSGSNAP